MGMMLLRHASAVKRGPEGPHCALERESSPNVRDAWSGVARFPAARLSKSDTLFPLSQRNIVSGLTAERCDEAIVFVNRAGSGTIAVFKRKGPS